MPINGGMKTSGSRSNVLSAPAPSVEDVQLERLIGHNSCLGANVTIQQAYEWFQSHPLEFCAVVRDHHYVGLCSRSHVGFLLGHRYGFAIYGRQTIGENLLPAAVTIQLGTPLREALRVSLSREGAEFNHDVVLINEKNQYVGLLQVTTLVRLQGQLMEEKFHALEAMQTELVGASRRAGMAEVATGILHNVGNILNSVNVSASILGERMRNSKTRGIRRIADLLKEPGSEMAQLLQAHPRGVHVLHYLDGLAAHLDAERAELIAEADGLCRNLEHIKRIVALQQTHARHAGVIEPTALQELVEHAVEIEAESLQRHGIEVARHYSDLPSLMTDRHQVLQILVNLISNAKHACLAGGSSERRISVRIEPGQDGFVQVQVIDNGVGIEAALLQRVFTHGFTTRKDGHGFGLHSGALAAMQLGGSLTAHSAGPGLGATFTLRLPTDAARGPATGAMPASLSPIKAAAQPSELSEPDRNQKSTPA